MARIRAVEYDRALVYASTTGESTIIAPDGRLIAHSGVWRQAILDARVPRGELPHARLPGRGVAGVRAHPAHRARARLGSAGVPAAGVRAGPWRNRYKPLRLPVRLYIRGTDDGASVRTP